METASGQFFALFLILRQSPSDSAVKPLAGLLQKRYPSSPAAMLIDRVQGLGKMLNHPTGGFKAERAIPTIARQRQIQIR